MKKISLLTMALASLLLIGAGCQKQKQERVTSLPFAVNELQTQTVPESQKQSVQEKITESTKSDVVLYRGSWFDIEYPKGFIPRPTAPTNVYNELINVQTDEARFVSPDGTVEFFVFSPLWAGDPADYLTVRTTEELVSEKIDESGADLNKKIVRWVTVKAKDGSYYRSFVSIKGQVGTGSDLHHVFGIKYQSDETYERHRDAYLAFKKSLRQYAD